MEHFDRLIRLHRLLRDRRTPLHYKDAAEQLGCSRSTFYRLAGQLRDVFQAPLENAPGGAGVYYDRDLGEFEFPGLWFTADELGALALLHSLLAASEPELLAEQIVPLTNRLDELLQQHGLNLANSRDRLRVLRMGGRQVAPSVFRTVGRGVLERRRLNIRYYNRGRDEINEREVSPQHLLRYRDNWYLDAWCHRARDLRSFAVECIREASLSREPARDIDADELEQRLTAGYGIFSGAPVGDAELVFTAERARRKS